MSDNKPKIKTKYEKNRIYAENKNSGSDCYSYALSHPTESSNR